MALWRKNKADGWTQEAPYAPTCSTGQQCGRVQWRSPHSPWCLSRCMEEVLRESSVHICFRGNFRRGVSRKTKLSKTAAVFFCGLWDQFSFVKDPKSLRSSGLGPRGKKKTKTKPKFGLRKHPSIKFKVGTYWNPSCGLHARRRKTLKRS